MVVATSSPYEGPSARTVLLQHWHTGSLCFGSSATSLKGRQIATGETRCECVLRFGQRQVRIRGRLSMGDDRASDAAWLRLTPEARAGLIELNQATPTLTLGLIPTMTPTPTLSNQGEPIDNDEHAKLEARVTKRIACRDRPWHADGRPESYRAFVLEPTSFEFYSGGHPGYVNDRCAAGREISPLPSRPADERKTV